MDVNDGKPDDNDLVGISGWLILPAIGTFVAPLILIKNLTESVSLVAEAGARVKDIAIMDVLMTSALLAFSLWLIYLLVTKKMQYPVYFVGFLVLNAVSIIVGISALKRHGFSSGGLDQDLFRSVLTGAIWGIYMLRSKRVKRTFIN